jgi:transglutaminase-like putative cysteine protease
MNQRRHVTLVGAAATLLATAPMATIFQSWTWLIDCILAVVAVCGTALLSRSLRAPVWAQALAMVAALTMIVTLLFGTHAFAGLIPTGRTMQHFGELLSQATSDIRNLGIPVPDRDGLLFLITVGVGGVAILADLFAVGLRQPALAGMPMLPLYSIPVIVHEDSVSFIPFVIGATGFLWLLASDNVDRVRRFGRRFTGDGRDVDLWEPSPLAAAGRRLAVVGVLLAILLPLAVPGMTSGLLDRFGTGGDGSGIGTGSGRAGASVNLFALLSGNLNQNKSIDMIKVTTNDPSPYYLRFGVADQLTPSGFRTRTPGSGRPVTSGIPDPALHLAGVTQGTYRARIQILNFDEPLLPIYTQLKGTSKLDRNWLYDPLGGLIYSTRRTSTKVKSYSFDYVRTEYSTDALRNEPPPSPNDVNMQLFTRIPANIDFVQRLVARLTAGKTNEYDKVRALYEYFSEKNNFSYSVSAKTGTSGSEIVDFLTNKTGYCEQYAAALAWLVRQAGYPARVAFGFTRGQGRNGDTYTMTNQNLHAWTEVYFNQFGWIPFDATPSVGLAGPVSTPWAPNVDLGGTANSTGVPTPLPDSSTSGGPNGAADPHNRADGTDLGDGATVKPAPTWPLWLLGGFGVLLVLLAQPALRRAVLRRRRGLGRRRRVAAGVDNGAVPGEMRVVPEALVDSGVARRQAHAAWDELIDTLVDYDIPVDEAETPRVTAERLVKKLRLAGPATEGARLLGRAEERARYARAPLGEVGIGTALRDVRRAIARYVPRRTRLRAVLLPPSVLRRWRYRAGEAFAAAVAAVSGRRDALVRVLSPRRLLPGRTGR